MRKILIISSIIVICNLNCASHVPLAIIPSKGGEAKLAIDRNGADINVIRTVKLSHDRKKIVIYDDDNVVSIFDCKSSKMKNAYIFPPDSFLSEISRSSKLTFMQNDLSIGEQCETGYTKESRNQIKIWDIKDGMWNSRIYTESSIDQMILSPDEKYIVTIHDSKASIRNIKEGGTEVASIQHDGNIVSVNFSHDGDTLVIANYSKLKVYDFKNKKTLKDMDISNICINKDSPFDLCVSNDSRIVAIIGNSQILEENENQDGGNELFIIDLKKKNKIFAFHGNILEKNPKANINNKFLAAAMPRNDLMCISYHTESADNSLLFLDPKTGSIIKSIPLPEEKSGKKGRRSFAFDNEGKILIHAYDKQLLFYNLKKLECNGTMMLTYSNNWVLVANDGSFDGTPLALSKMSWFVGKDQISLSSFDISFLKDGLLGRILDLDTESKNKRKNLINIGKQLVGRISKIQGRMITVSSPEASKHIRMGEKMFIFVEGKKVQMKVMYPMMTVAKCKLQNQYNRYLSKISIGMPVFK